LSQGFRRKDATADCPQQAGTSPCHAMEKAAAINPVVLVIVRNVIGHNFFFRFNELVFVLHLSLPIWFAFIPKILEGYVRDSQFLQKRRAQASARSAASEFAKYDSITDFPLCRVRSAGQRSN
jgi:hypothetical protein